MDVVLFWVIIIAVAVVVAVIGYFCLSPNFCDVGTLLSPSSSSGNSQNQGKLENFKNRNINIKG